MSEKVNQADTKEMNNKEESIPKIEYSITKVDDQFISIEGASYKLQKNYQNAFDLSQFKERYTDLFEKFDYIVGDLGYDQLRLRGFYYDDTQGVPLDVRISSLEDYLIEYCNFGCAYFVLERQEEKTVFPNYNRRDRLKNQGNRKKQKNKDKKTPRPRKSVKSRGHQSSKKTFEKKQNKFEKRNMASNKKDEVKVKEIQDETGKKRFQIKKKK